MTTREASEEPLFTPLEPPRIDRNLNRSPHLYHRQSISLTRNDATDLANTLAQDESSGSSSERGTEADDEKGPILRGLPAPPLRARKGWKGSRSPVDLTPAISPFPSPPLSDHGQTYFSSKKDRRKSRAQKAAGRQYIDPETYSKYRSRRRAEVVRRCTETALIGVIGMIVCRKAMQTDTLQPWIPEMKFTGATILILYATYPIQLVLHRLRLGQSLASSVSYGVHVPSRFDPGPLLYPVLFPFFIAVSLIQLNEPSVLVNLILGTASIPQKLFPEFSVQFSTIFHWTLCLGPLARTSALPTDLFSQTATVTGVNWADSLNIEALTLLFPLHQALLGIIKYLTTTSLDPAEIQLLSTGLINLLLFASSPQSRILQAILWPGMVCVLISCYIPLRWEVALARIPTWKFARNRSPKAGLMSKLESALSFILPTNSQRNRPPVDSDDDEDYEHLRQARRRSRANGRLSLSQTTVLPSIVEPLVARHEDVTNDKGINGLTRSVTLPAPPPPRKLQRQSSISSRSGLLALTLNQAQAVKWIIAGYVYIAVVSIAIGILWPYIGRTALSSYEPFGWAIGYLLGNIPQLRLWVVSNNLERWVALPLHRLESKVFSPSGWLEQYRQTTQGPANTRLLLIGYCLVILGVGLTAVFRLRSVVEVDTRRKIFHGIMVAMMLPIIPVDPCFVSLALVVILALFLLLDMFRASQLPPLSKPLTAFLAPYVDGRDYRGPVVISHIFLLIGCAIPLWLALAGTPRNGRGPWVGWEAATRDLSMISGVVCVGMGDAAASLIGRRYGRTKWFWGGGKSIEGSCAFVAAVTLGLMASYLWLRAGGWIAWDTRTLPHATMQAVIAASGASLLESVLTAANDNVVVPVGLWLLVRGLEPVT